MPLQIIRQNITKMKVDAIVDTTNPNMIGVSGIDREIHRAAGIKLESECKRFVPIRDGEAVVTSGYNLGCKYIIHTSGPVWHGGTMNEKRILESCYSSCLLAAYERGCETVAFPLISSGANGYPKDQVLKLAVRIIREFLYENEMTVFLCVFDQQSYEFSKKLYTDITDYINNTSSYALNRSADIPVRTKESPYPNCARIDFRNTFYDSKQKQSICHEDASPENLNEWLKKQSDGFAETLFRMIDKSGMTDTQCYKRANVSRKTFSKIKCNSDYKPSKQTAVAFAIALHLDLAETETLLSSAGFTLSHSFKFDIIIEYFILRKCYDIFEINEALFEFDQLMLGC